MEIHELIPEGPWDDESGPSGAMTEEQKQEYRLDQQDEEERSPTMEQWAQGWADKLNPKAFEEHGAAIRQHRHTTQSTEVEIIDITPVGGQTSEGVKRVQEAQQAWDSATHELANYLKNVVDDIFYSDGDKIARAEMYSELQTLIGIREVKQEAFLRAVCGQPERPSKPKLETYPATVNGKTVQVTIPED